MPKSRNRRKRSNSDYVRNLIRGAGDNPVALTLARLAPAYDRDDGVTWATRILATKGPLSLMNPRSLRNLLSLPFQDSLEIEQELEWVVSIVRRFAGRVNDFLLVSLAIQNAILSGDEGSALALIQALESKIGITLFGISNRIALMQLAHGLEAQKEYVATIRNSPAPQNVKFLTYWWGVRAEDATSADNFVTDIRNQKRHWPEAEELRAILAYHLIGEIPVSGREASLLAGAMSTTAVDYYEVFIRLAQTVIGGNRPSKELFKAAACELSRVIKDPRLARLSGVADPEQPQSLLWRDFAVSSDTKRPCEIPHNISEIAWRARGNDLLNNGPVVARFEAAVVQLADASSYRKAKADLKKLGLALSHNPIGDWIGLFERQPFYDRLDIDFEALVSRYLVSAHLDVEGMASAETHASVPSPHEASLSAVQAHPFGKMAFALAGRIAVSDELSATLDEIYARRLDISEGYRAHNGQSILEAAQRLEAAQGHPSRISIEAKVIGKWWSDGLAEATSTALNYLLDAPDLRVWLPVRQIAEALVEGYDPDKATIAQAIILNHATELDAAMFASDRSYALEDALRNAGVRTPSEYASKIATAATPADLHFLHRVCTREALRRTTIFLNSADLLQDRIDTLKWLSEFGCDLSEAASEQAINLVRSQQVQKGLEVLKGSKLSIDRTPLIQWAKENIEEDFVRFKDLIATGLFKVDDKLRQAVYDVIEKGGGSTEELAIPDNEAAALFARLVRKTVSELAINAEHGLDAYLSLRIRHGTLSGHLRGPVEREHLITRKRGDGVYLDNEYWFNQIASDNERYIAGRVNDRLKEFAQEYDNIIDRLAGDVIQIRSANKPQGVLRFEVPPALVSGLLVEVTDDITFSRFFEQCEEMFWTMVVLSLTSVREEALKASEDFSSLLDHLSRNVASLQGSSLGLLNDAILRAKSGVTQALNEMVEWLETPTERTELSLTIRELIDISLSTIRGFYPDFQPHMDIDLGDVDDVSLSGVARFFTDVFFILFENVLKYSGDDRSPEIKIRVWSEDRSLHFKICNSVEETTSVDRKRIDAARDRVDSGEYKTALRVEGGTGLPKLAKLIGHGEKGAGRLSFGLAEDGSEFSVHFSMQTLVPHVDEKEPVA